jgi:hypothetical protein
VRAELVMLRPQAARAISQSMTGAPVLSTATQLHIDCTAYAFSGTSGLIASDMLGGFSSASWSSIRWQLMESCQRLPPGFGDGDRVSEDPAVIEPVLQHHRVFCRLPP